MAVRAELVLMLALCGAALALAREVMRMHGGDITVESELNKGSTFRLVVPQFRAAA